ncbi:hypothetical protein [Iodidimonas gelatinilytica]|nr:hypothetical protein [Iodidimonas gelatinilytica]
MIKRPVPQLAAILKRHARLGKLQDHIAPLALDRRPSRFYSPPRL